MDILRKLTYGLFIISTNSTKLCGCVSNTVVQLSSGDKKLIGVSLNKNNFTTKEILDKKLFSVSILSKEVSSDVINEFGFTSSKDNDKFSKFNYSLVDDMPILNEGIIGYILVKVVNIVDADTHYLIIGEIYDSKVLNEGEVLTYKYYQDNLKQIKTNGVSYRCPVCGYIHNGELPDGFKCPLCGLDGSKFEKVS